MATTAVDASTGGGVSVVGVVTVAVVAGVLGGLRVDLPRAQSVRLARTIRRLLFVSGVSLVVFTGLYLLAQRSAFGQRLERDVLLGSGADIIGVRGDATAVLNQVTVGIVGLLTVAACLLAVVRGRLRLAIGTAVGIALTIASAQVLKSLLLARPVLLGSGAVATAQSYPSGHVAAAAALGAALVVAAPLSWRRHTAGIAMVLTGMIGVAVLVAGWHRPSDAIGAAALAIGVSSAIAAILVRRGSLVIPEAPSDTTGLPPRIWSWGAYALAAGAALFAIVELARLQTVVTGPQHLAAFIAGSLVFIAADIVGFAALATSLRGADATERPPGDGQDPGPKQRGHRPDPLRALPPRARSELEAR
ncbi:MAG: phosphatase PAP2 family protein [Candidatus Dormibacter sp.]